VLAELGAEYGTPLFVVDEGHIRARLEAFREAFGDRTVLVYAGKAFLCGALVHLLDEAGWWVDAVSAGEVELVLRAGLDPSRVLLHGNAKPRAEIETAVRAGVARVVVDHPAEIRTIAAVAAKRGSGGSPAMRGDPHVLLRLNADVAAVTHEKVKTTGVAAQFGMTVDIAAEAAAIVASTPRVQLAGVHIHVGSQIGDLDTFRRAAEAAVDFVAPIRPLFGACVDMDLGGGLAAPYLSGDPAPRPADFAAAVLGGLENAEAERRVGPFRLLVEPGRSVVANAGITLYRVEARKRLPDGGDVLGVDGGLSDNPRPSLYGQRYEVLPVSRPVAGSGIPFRVVGRHCETGDLISSCARLPEETDVGDIVAVAATGAYAYSMSSRYNGLPRPPVLFVDAGDARVVVRRETIEDLFACDAALSGGATAQSSRSRTSTLLSNQPSGSNLSSSA
jgi:diaminopimelate decarboxylase